MTRSPMARAVLDRPACLEFADPSCFLESGDNCHRVRRQA